MLKGGTLKPLVIIIINEIQVIKALEQIRSAHSSNTYHRAGTVSAISLPANTCGDACISFFISPSLEHPHTLTRTHALTHMCAYNYVSG